MPRLTIGADNGTPVELYYDTFATDLKVLLEYLDLTGVTLVGLWMGGGEVVTQPPPSTPNCSRSSARDRVVLA